MPEYHPCHYFGGGIVEITDERCRHVLSRQDNFSPPYWERAGETIRDPDQAIMREQDKGAVMLYHWYDDIDKNVVAVVRTDASGRHWLVTAYMTRNVARGELLWRKG